VRVVYLIILAIGIVAILYFFSWLEIHLFQRGMAKHGERYESPYDIMKIGYAIAFMFFVSLSLWSSGGKMGGSDYEPEECTGSMRC
jgi:hypothetical protein